MAADEFDFRRVSFDLAGGTVAGVAFGDAARPPDLLFLHATGLNALTYRRLLAPLGAHAHVVAIDVRGHGRTDLPQRLWRYRSWNRHRDDVIAVLARFFSAPVALAGHSMGATTALLVAGARPDLARGLCLIDPVIRPPGGVVRTANELADRARRRRGGFASKAEALEALVGRGFFKTFPAPSLADYVEDGFRDDGRGGVRLACAPAYEAATFAAQAHDVWPALESARGPLIVLRAETGSTLSETAARAMAARRPDARIETVQGSTHALPIENPERARGAIETMLALAHGLTAPVR